MAVPVATPKLVRVERNNLTAGGRYVARTTIRSSKTLPLSSQVTTARSCGNRGRRGFPTDPEGAPKKTGDSLPCRREISKNPRREWRNQGPDYRRGKKGDEKRADGDGKREYGSGLEAASGKCPRIRKARRA